MPSKTLVVLSAAALLGLGSTAMAKGGGGNGGNNDMAGIAIEAHCGEYRQTAGG